MIVRRFLLLPSTVLFLAACTGGGTADAGLRADLGAPVLCSNDVDCDDGLFCNGAERCMHTLGADPHGCLPAPRGACAATQLCDESARLCNTDCMRASDADADGHAARSCGGDDCDDANPAIHPGATELCDSAGLDEDCDVATIGGPTDSDLDGDGFVRNNCCDAQPGGALICGTDCVDGDATIHPGATEICNGLDDDCNSRIDDGATRTYHVDADRDGHGDATLTLTGPCTPPAGSVLDASDCDDTDPAVHPGAVELCDGVDQTCEGVLDEGCPAGPVTITPGATGPMPVGTGAIFFDDVCPSGEVLVGLAVATDAGGLPTRAGGLCAPLTIATETTSSPYLLHAALGATSPLPEHGAAATTSPSTCVAREAATAIGPGLALGCGELALTGHAGTFALGTATDAERVGPGTGEPAGMTFHCPDGSVGIALAGYEVSGTFAITGMTCAHVAPGLIPGA